jgi:UDP-arabinose 4-epimerase
LNVLVTGGAGYIGSHTCKALAAAGLTPITYDNLSSGHEWAVKWGSLVKGDILDRRHLRNALETYRPTAVMHFAAYADVGESVEQPLKYYSNNVVGTLTLLEVMRDLDVKDLIFSSTCATYGMPKMLPITETHSQSPINPYGMSKLVCERILADCSAAYGLRSVCLRYFNAAGSDPDREIGEEREVEGHLIPLVLNVAAGRRSHLTIFGTEYDTPDGTCIRDYVHVTDLAQAHVLALKALRSNNSAAAYNLGTGRGFSVNEVIQAARSVTDCSIPIKEGARRLGDPPELVADATRATKELGWTCRYRDLNQIISTAWAWIVKRQTATLASTDVL